ncbi:hypothetical protein ACXAT3_002665 [Clostridium sporogenes]
MGNFKPAWDVEYNCSVLPNLMAPFWTIVGDIKLMNIIDNMLYINDNSTTSPSFLGMENVVENDKITTFECDIKIINASNFISIQMQINDSQKGILLGLEPKKITIFDNNYPFQIIKSISVDLTNFNKIKLIKYGQTKFQVYINDTLIEENNYFYNVSNSNGIYVGAGSTPQTGSCFIKNIRYCLDGIPIYYPNSYLINQNNNYYSTKSNFINLGQPIDNTQLKNWYYKYGADDINTINQDLDNKEFPMSKDENGIWETDFRLDINEIKDNIELINIDENNKSIKYNCNDYRILDLCDDEFYIMQNGFTH